MTAHYDAVIIGGGHNGLVAASYLARAGLSVVVCERRPVVGGAAVSEHPFGPDYTVTSLSYVVSLLPEAVVRDLRLRDFGYHVYPQGAYFAPRREGRYLALPRDPHRRAQEIAKFSRADVAAYEYWDAWLARMGRIVGPLLLAIPPRLGSHRPMDLVHQAGLLRRLRELDVRGAVDLTRLLTSSIADLVEPRFESDAMRGVLSVSGVIGAWAGPRSPGTAYVMLHHHVGDPGLGAVGMWGFPRGGMGAVTRALASSARAAGAAIHADASVARIDVRAGRAVGVTLASGEQVSADIVVTTAHPQISFLRLLDATTLPPDFVEDIEHWRSRSGVVKVNFAVDRLPVFSSHPDVDPDIHGGTIVLAESLDDVEDAFQDAVHGRPAALPFADVAVPSVVDDSLAPAGHHVISMFAQWVPHTWSSDPQRADLDTFADRLMARMEAVAPGFANSVLHRQVLGPYELEQEYALIGGNIFHGELSLGQLFHARPAAGYADYRTPIRGLYQAGSAAHGGGGVTGIPGRNVVRQILVDRRVAHWRRGRLAT
jgi:phytoene dehydrogenase-like protein